MLKITIIGSGNLALHLILAFQNKVEVEIIQVFSRDKNSLFGIIEPNKIIDDYSKLLPSDIIVIAVSDNAIAEVSSKIPFENRLVVHTSGGMGIDVLNKKHRRGVLYPLQSFSKNKAIDFRSITVCIETETELDLELLETIAKTISDKIYNINSIQRKALHISAVFVNNFVNHLYQIGNEICIENNVDFEILKPLILETANKISEISPKLAQTGPAKRNDTKVIKQHLDFITNENQQNIYKILTQSIQQNG